MILDVTGDIVGGMPSAAERRAVRYPSLFGLVAALGAGLGGLACSAPSTGDDSEPIEVFPPDAAEDMALAFDGTDDYASTGSAGFPFARLHQTVSFWLKAVPSGGADQTVVTLRKDWESGVRIGLCGGLLCARSVYSRNLFLQAMTPLATGEWHHISYQFDGSDDTPHHTLYLDGVVAATGTALPEKRTPTSGFLGSTDGTELFFAGEIDELRIWSVARTPEQVAAEIAGQAPDQEPTDLVAYYTFDEVSGARVIDRSGRGNHALLGDGLSSRMPLRVLSGVAEARP